MRGAMRGALAALRQSGAARFAAKFLADDGMGLATLIAWGTLSTVFPVLLGITAVAGVLLQDHGRSARLSAILVQLVPAEAALPLGAILDDARRDAGTWGIVGLVLLLFNGSNLFANMQSVFNRAYRVPHRGFVEARLISLFMLVIATALLLLSAAAYGLGGLLASASEAVARALLSFLLLYRVLPNKRQTFAQVLPGSLLATGLFFILLQVFPLYTALFGRGFEAYAIFGMLLLLMFWTYLLGVVLVLGAELNAFLAAS